MDKDDNLYFMAANTRLSEGKEVSLPRTETLMKIKPKEGRFISANSEIPIPLAAETKPKTPPDVARSHSGTCWVEGAQWFYGGVGYGGFNVGSGCACWNARFALDYFARSFAPSPDHYSVAVLDTNGNLILRLGRYGNVEDGLPMVKDGGPANPRSLGGDEVALARAQYVGVDSDKRLFIADAGNARIVSVKLNYHASEKVALKDVPNRE
jgi:hypothetical protein